MGRCDVFVFVYTCSLYLRILHTCVSSIGAKSLQDFISTLDQRALHRLNFCLGLFCRGGGLPYYWLMWDILLSSVVVAWFNVFHVARFYVVLAKLLITFFQGCIFLESLLKL